MVQTDCFGNSELHTEKIRALGQSLLGEKKPMRRKRREKNTINSGQTATPKWIRLT
jgi:hypothetical protein